MGKLSRIHAVAIVVAGLGVIPQGVQAQDSSGDYNPPSRAARLSWVEGSVSFQPGGVDDWVPATLNRPFTTGDRLWSDAGGRAELHLGSAALRLGSRTNFTFLNWTDNTTQVQLSAGTLSVRVRNLAGQEAIEIDTPQAAFSLLQAGDYGIDVNERGDSTMITVRGGQAEGITNTQTFPLGARESVRVYETNGRQEFERRQVPVADAFDNWCQGRDRREDISQSALHFARQSRLRGPGRLRDVATGPAVFIPLDAPVSAGWAPYRYGQWAWIEPGGWVPGPIVVRPVYSPALVAWVGRTSGLGFQLVDHPWAGSRSDRARCGCRRIVIAGSTSRG
ncbi:MAG: hypothetical protein ABIR70_10575 [Bryobacteraceae bacterium]